MIARSDIKGLNTPMALLNKLTQAAARGPSRGEMFEQRVSYVLGAIGRKNKATREYVEEVLNQGCRII